MEKQGTEQDTVTKVRKNITVPEDLYLDFLSLGDEGESQRDLLGRLIDRYRDNAELREQIVSLRESRDVFEAEVTSLRVENDLLRNERDNLEIAKSPTALTSPAGQSSFSDFGGELVKDTMDAIKDVCDDEVVCVKTALHMVDTKAAVMDKQLDRNHSAEQKHLDREDKEKDRQLKLELAEKKAQHERDMIMIKKGIVKEEDLEGVVFLGSMEKRKTAGERLAGMKNRAYHAAAGEEDDFGDPGDGDFNEGEDLGDVDPPEYEDHDHA